MTGQTTISCPFMKVSRTFLMLSHLFEAIKENSFHLAFSFVIITRFCINCNLSIARSAKKNNNEYVLTTECTSIRKENIDIYIYNVYIDIEH